MCVFLISTVPITEPLTSDLIDTPVFYNLAPRPIKYRVSVPIPSWRCCSGLGDPLEDCVLKVFVDQEVLDWQLLCGHLHFSRQQGDEPHRPVHRRPPTRFRRPLKQVQECLCVILGTNLIERHMGGWGCGRLRLLSPNLPVNPAPEQLAVFLLGLEEGLETPFLIIPHSQRCLMVFLVKTCE